jgi:hypothetical protein
MVIFLMMGILVTLCTVLLMIGTPIYGQQQEDNNTTSTFGQILEDVMETEELQKQ